MSIVNLRQSRLIQKAAGYTAKVGETIRGALKRGTGGRFSSSGGSATATDRTAKPAPSSARALRQSEQASRRADKLRDSLKRDQRSGSTSRRSQRLTSRTQAKKQSGGKGGGAAKVKPDKAAQAAQQAVASGALVGLSAEEMTALTAAANGEQISGNYGKLVQLGLIGNDGIATDAGRMFLRGAETGNRRTMVAALQNARNAVAREQRVQQVTAERMSRRAIRRTNVRTKAATPEQSHIAVFKSADGVYHWIARSSTAYRDKDGEIVSIAALQEDTDYLQQQGNYGPLRWWHVGGVNKRTLKADFGIDIGDCHGAAVVGKTLIEWGTLRKAEYAALIKADDEISIGFIPLVAKDRHNVYTSIRRFERSVCPAGKARNLYTGISVGAS